MVLNFDEELNLQEYTISNQGSERTRSVKPDNISNILEEAPNEIPNNQLNVDFTNSELEYLTCHSLTAHAFENSEIDVSCHFKPNTPAAKAIIFFRVRYRHN